MKKIFSILLAISTFGLSQAMYIGNVFGGMQMFAMNDTVRTPRVFDMKEKAYKEDRHAVATERILFLDQHNMEQKLLESENYNLFAKSIRQDIVEEMVKYGFDAFVERPWQTANEVITFSTGDLSYTMTGSIVQHDALDEILAAQLLYYKKYFDEYKKFSSYAKFPEVEIPMDQLLSLKDIYLFKDNSDLQSLGYEIVSYRDRINDDKEYRTHNISTAFANMGNIVILNPEREYNVMSELHYSQYADDGKKPYVRGYAIFGNTERLVYAGGLCGVATAVNQGILTNTALEVIEKKAHSKWYRDLYSANVNGEWIDTPGLDATVYFNQVNIRFKNIRDYPIILIMNYNGTKGGKESVFTLAPNRDKGSFSYQGSYYRNGRKCYTREINGRNERSCYREVVLN